MLSKKTLWNRALLFLGVVAMVAVPLLVFHFTTGLPPIGTDSIGIVEENPFADVLYSGIGEEESYFLGDTPVAAVGLAFYTPAFDDVDARYHVRLTPNGWEYIKGKYDWSPDLEEEYTDKIHLWNFEKFHWWKDMGGMFKPGEYNRVYEAMYGLLDWYQDKMFADAIYRIIVWAEGSGQEYNAIEIDFLMLSGPVVVPAYVKYPTYVVSFQPMLRGTLIMFKVHTEIVDAEYEGGAIYQRKIRHVTTQEIVTAGELEYEELQEMLESGQMQVVPGMTFLGQRAYTKGFNHPWQGRELSTE